MRKLKRRKRNWMLSPSELGFSERERDKGRGRRERWREGWGDEMRGK